MPELSLKADREYTCLSVTAEKYRRYTEYMEKNQGDSAGAAVRFDAAIIKMMFDMPERVVMQAEIEEMLLTSKMIHFVMQEIVVEKFLELNPQRPELVEEEPSVFDDYDRENGYDIEEQQENVWKICRDNLDRVIKLCIRMCGDSLSACMNMDIMSLLDHVAFEIRTINER